MIDLQGCLRNHQAWLLLPFLNHRGHELTVDQFPIGIRNRRSHDQGVGQLVDLRIGQVPNAALRIVPAVGEANADIDFRETTVFLASCLADDLEIAHAHRKQHVDGILADDGCQDATCGIDEVADRVGRAADAAINRRADVSVIEVHLRLGQGRLRLQHLGLAAVESRLLPVNCGLRSVLLLGQPEGASILKLGVRRLGLCGSDIRLGLVNLCLELHLLDLIEQVTRFDVLAFAKQDLFEEALDARAHVHLTDGLDAPDELEGLAHAPQGRWAHAHGRLCQRRVGLLGLVTPSQQGQDEADGRQQAHAKGAFLHHAKLSITCPRQADVGNGGAPDVERERPNTQGERRVAENRVNIGLRHARGY